MPSFVWKRTGFQVGTFGSRTSSPGVLQPAFLRVAPQMATSGRPSPAPPNQADIRSPLASSTTVEAWHDGNGADSKTNSSTDCARAADASRRNNGTIRRMGDVLAA